MFCPLTTGFMFMNACLPGISSQKCAPKVFSPNLFLRTIYCKRPGILLKYVDSPDTLKESQINFILQTALSSSYLVFLFCGTVWVQCCNVPSEALNSVQWTFLKINCVFKERNEKYKISHFPHVVITVRIRIYEHCTLTAVHIAFPLRVRHQFKAVVDAEEVYNMQGTAAKSKNNGRNGKSRQGFFSSLFLSSSFCSSRVSLHACFPNCRNLVSHLPPFHIFNSICDPLPFRTYVHIRVRSGKKFWVLLYALRRQWTISTLVCGWYRIGISLLHLSSSSSFSLCCWLGWNISYDDATHSIFVTNPYQPIYPRD